MGTHGSPDAGLSPMQGVCKNDVCVCPQGYRGDYCEIAPACTGILDAAGNCCPRGIVSVTGTCCSGVGSARRSASIMWREEFMHHQGSA